MNRLKISKRFPKLLRARAGTTLVELIVSAALMCLLIALAAACLEPAARITKQLREQNEAQTIADDLLSTVKSRIEGAQGYIKCYASDDPYSGIGGQTGVATGTEGKALEFLDENGYVVLLSTGGTIKTELRRATNDGGAVVATADPVKAGYLVVRYYASSNGHYAYWKNTSTGVARALTQPYAKGFYMGFFAQISYVLDGPAGSSNATAVTVTARIYRDEAMTQQLFSDSLVVDLRYAPPVRTDVTADLS